MAGDRAATVTDEVDHADLLRRMGRLQARHDLHHHVAPALAERLAALPHFPRGCAVIGILHGLHEGGGTQSLHQLLAIGGAPVIQTEDVGQQPLGLVAAVASAQAVDVVDRHAEASWSRDAAWFDYSQSTTRKPVDQMSNVINPRAIMSISSSPSTTNDLRPTPTIASSSPPSQSVRRPSREAASAPLSVP